MAENTNANNRYNSTGKSAQSDVEGAFLAYAMANTRYFAEVADNLSAADFSLIPHKNIFSALYDSVKRGIQPTYAELLSELEGEEDRNEAVRLSEIGFVAEDPAAYLKDCIRRIGIRKKEQERQALIEALHGATGEQMRKLLAEIGEIDKELSRSKLE